MESAIVEALKPDFSPVTLVWSDTVPDDTLQFKEGRFGCILYLFAEASRRGRVAGGSRESITCNGGCAALGFGVDLDESEERLDRYAALFSKGARAAHDKEAFLAEMESAPKGWRDMYEHGERRHANADLARAWILQGLPRFDIPFAYVLFKPLPRTALDDNIQAVIFPVSPIELGGLLTLAGSVMEGTDSVRVAPGPDCMSLAAFAYAEGESPEPRAVLGMVGLDGREVMRKRFRDDILTLTLPWPLFRRMEEEAGDSIFQTPAWEALAKTSHSRDMEV